MILKLKQGDIVLGLLLDIEHHQNGDAARFEPTDAFLPLKPLFDAVIEACSTKDDSWSEKMNKVERLELTLENEDGEDSPAGIIHIDGDRAHFWY